MGKKRGASLSAPDVAREEEGAAAAATDNEAGLRRQKASSKEGDGRNRYKTKIWT